MKLAGDEVRVVGQLDDFDQVEIGIHAGKNHPLFGQLLAIVVVDLEAMAVALANLGDSIERGSLAAH